MPAEPCGLELRTLSGSGSIVSASGDGSVGQSMSASAFCVERIQAFHRGAPSCEAHCSFPPFPSLQPFLAPPCYQHSRCESCVDTFIFCLSRQLFSQIDTKFRTGFLLKEVPPPLGAGQKGGLGTFDPRGRGGGGNTFKKSAGLAGARRGAGAK